MKEIVRVFSFLASVLHTSLVLANQAQPVPIPEDPSTAPQIEVDGVGIGTIGVGKTPERKKAEAKLNFTDSALLIGASQRLYNGGIGSFGIGVLTTEASSSVETGLFLHRAFVDYQTEKFEVLIGRSDNPTAHLIDFPTIRDDDLTTLNNPLNPFSNGKIVQEHRYSDLAQIVFNKNLSYFANFHAQHLVDSSKTGSDSGINSGGVTIEYLAPPGLEAFQRVPSWAIAYENIIHKEQSQSGIHQILVGSVINLNESVTDRVDLRFQDILTLGSKLASFTSTTDTFSGDSNAVAVALRYLNSPFGKPGYQVSLTGGYKKYLKIKSGKTYGGALTGVRRLGQGFDLVAQYQGQWRDSKLATFQSSGLRYESAFEIGFIFEFNATFNRHISPRRTLMNQQHQYIPD